MLVELRIICALASAASAVAGCAVHPLPENYPLNFPRASTFDLVRKVRCELKAGIERAKNGSSVAHANQIVKATSVGYYFKLTMTEDNNLAGGSLRLVGSAKQDASKLDRTLDLSGDAAHKRNNERRFQIVETLHEVERADCGPKSQLANLSYPISGRLRLDDLSYAYVHLEMVTNFGEPDEGITLGGRKLENGVLSEVISFDTSVSLGAVPKLKLTVAPGSFGVQSGTISGIAKRADSHELVIAFAQDPNLHSAEAKRAAAERKALLAQRRVGTTEKKVIRSARLETVLAQANANSHNKVFLELARLRNLLDDEQERSRFIGERLLTFLRPPDETRPGD